MENLNDFQKRINVAITIDELIEIAGYLNNYPENIHSDQVSCLGFISSLENARNHVQHMLNNITKKRCI